MWRQTLSVRWRADSARSVDQHCRYSGVEMRNLGAAVIDEEFSISAGGGMVTVVITGGHRNRNVLCFLGRRFLRFC